MAGFKIYNHQQAHFITFAVIEWIDVFTRPAYKNIVVESLQYCQKEKGLNIHGWCIMTNHIHLVISEKKIVAFLIYSETLKSLQHQPFLKILNSIKKKAEGIGCCGCLEKQERGILTIRNINSGDKIIVRWKLQAMSFSIKKWNTFTTIQ